MEMTKAYPGWKNALEKILIRVKLEGYGVIFSHEELLALMDIQIPQVATLQELQKYQLETLSSVENLKDTLIEEYSLYLMNIRGVGYQILHPNDQVDKAPKKHLKKMRKELTRAMTSLTNVHAELLDYDRSQARVRGLARLAFIRAAINKKKIFIDEKEQLKIANG
jgi:hypothetical protein